MGRDLTQEQANNTVVTHVEFLGEKLIIPEKMTIDSAVELLIRQKKYLDRVVEIREKFDVFPFDGAYALSQILSTKFGWAEGVPIKTMFGEQKPTVFKIPSSPYTKVDVPWGLFSLPHIDGTLETEVAQGPSGRLQFELTAAVKRKDESTVRGIFDALRAYLRHNSLYRGKAVKIRFRDDDGDPLTMPEPEFLDVSTARQESLIFSLPLAKSIQDNLFTPITRVDDCIANNIKVKRGVLLGGLYGTGKTLAAMVAANLAEKAGITYVYSPRASELGDAIAFAKQYQSPACVVFCEDIDRSMSGERSVEIDDILNILDGIDTKSENIIVVLTTNSLEKVNRAMLRPGRLDAIIDVTPPDADAAERLVRYYGGLAIEPTEDLTAVGRALAGQIPAVIEETVKRAKLSQLTLNNIGSAVTHISAEALDSASFTMTRQIELLAEPAPAIIPALDKALSGLVQVSVEEVLSKRNA